MIRHQPHTDHSHRTPFWGVRGLAPLIVGAAAFAAFSFALLLPSTSFAQGDEFDERAVEHFNQGAEYFHEGRYGAALTEFRRAYRLEPNPMIRYNMALAHLRLGNLADALDHSKRLAESGGLPQGETTRNAARVAALTAVFTARDVGEDISTIVTQPDDDDDDRVVVTPDAPSRIGKLGTTGLVGSLLGVGALSFAVVVDYRLGGKIEQYEQAADDRDLQNYQVLRGDIESSTKNGTVALYTGAGLLGAGLTLFAVDFFLRDHSTGELGSVSLQPHVASTEEARSAILLLTGSF